VRLMQPPTHEGTSTVLEADLHCIPRFGVTGTQPTGMLISTTMPVALQADPKARLVECSAAAADLLTEGKREVLLQFNGFHLYDFLNSKGGSNKLGMDCFEAALQGREGAQKVTMHRLNEESPAFEALMYAKKLPSDAVLLLLQDTAKDRIRCYTYRTRGGKENSTTGESWELQHVDGEWDGAGFSKFRVDDVDLIHRDNAHEKDVVERTYDLMKQHITAADDSGVITLKSFKSYLGSHDKDHRNVQELVPLNTFQSDKMFKQMSQGGSTVNLEQFRAWWATIHEVPTRASC